MLLDFDKSDKGGFAFLLRKSIGYELFLCQDLDKSHKITFLSLCP